MPLAGGKLSSAKFPIPAPRSCKNSTTNTKMSSRRPASPTPGFRQPFKAKFQYVKADYDKILAAESPKITEQEIKDYYDEHKDEFKKIQPSRFAVHWRTGK